MVSRHRNSGTIGQNDDNRLMRPSEVMDMRVQEPDRHCRSSTRPRDKSRDRVSRAMNAVTRRSSFSWITSPAMAQDHVRKIDGDIKVLKCVVQEMEYCRNTLVPISRLPPETLAVIFSLLPFIAHDSDGVPYLASIYVSRVCRRWREIALSFPSLWSHIHFTKLTPTGIPKILARAKTSPLHLEAKIIPQRKARFNAFVNLLEARISHTRHITISGQFRTMLKRLVSPAPALVFLSLKTLLHPYISSLSQYIIPDSLFNGTAPKLTRLDLYGCSIGSKSPLLKDLQILKIWTPSAQEMPTLQDWLAGLNEMPQLKILTVHHATPTISGDSPRISEPQRIVTLHSLTHSDIFAPANDGALALAHLILPALISLHMAVESRSEDGDDVRLLLPYVARNAYGPQDAAPLQTIEFNGEPMHPQIVAWTIPDADVGVRDSVTLKKVVVSARLDLFITSYSGWRDGMETEISDAMLSHLPLNAISTLSAQNYT